MIDDVSLDCPLWQQGNILKKCLYDVLPKLSDMKKS